MKVIGFVLYDASLAGGTERVIINIANYYAQKGNAVKLISCVMSSSNIAFEIDKRIDLINLDVGNYPYGIIKIFQYHHCILKKLKRIATNWDYIFGSGCQLNVFLSYLKVKSIGCEHINYESPHILWKILRWFRYRFLYKVISLTEKDALKYSKIGANIKAIPNYVKLHNRKSTLLNKKIVSVGRLESQKGFDILITIIGQIKDSLGDWIVEVYGEGKLRNALQEQINLLGLQDKVILMGIKNNLDDIYLNSSIFLLTSRFEGFPMVLLEAQNYGLPIVSFDCPTGPSEIIENNIDGFIVKNGDTNVFGKKVVELLEDEKLRISMGKFAANNIVRFSENVINKMWDDVIGL